MKNLGLATPQILLPNSKVNMKKWTVIACDQYNSNFEYWSDVEKIVGNNPSTLRMILPEIYLDDEEDTEARISEVSHFMEDYLSAGVIEALPEGFVLVQRKLPSGVRTGLMGMIDLEHYEFETDANPKVRPTEETVLERIPPRVKIRKPALLESPHILVLLNDKDKKVIEPIAAKAKKLPKLYDFDLMKDGGSIEGSFVGEQEDIDQIYEKLAEVDKNTDILFCVGDGNHSLATAKTVWDEFKQELSEEQILDHPKRFALVEIVNLYDEGLSFEPIHRVVFGVDSNKLVSDLIKLFNKSDMDAKIFFKRSSASSFVKNTGGQTIDFIAKQKRGYIKLDNPKNELEGVNFQNILDEYLKQNPDVKVEFIHGLDEVERLCEENYNTGFILPKLEKDSFIDVLAKQGVLPKKCFSLGEADEKRFYLECRLLDVVSDMGEHAELTPSDDFEEDEEILEGADVQQEGTDSKKKWFYDGNNEDIISFAFSDDDGYLDEDDLDLDANMYLGKKEVKRLKKQKRLEEILEHESSDIIKDNKEYLDEFEYDIPLTRREKKLIAKQREYEILLEQIGEEKKKNANIKDEAEAYDDNKYAQSNNFSDQEQEDFDNQQDEIEEVEELLNKANLTRKEKKALKKEQKLKKKLEELGIDEQDLNDIGEYEPGLELDDEVTIDSEDGSEIEFEQKINEDSEFEIKQEVLEKSEHTDEEDDYELENLKATWAQRKQEKKLEKQQRMQAMLDSFEQSQEADDETDFDQIEEQEVEQSRGLFGWRAKRESKKKRLRQRMDELYGGLEEESLDADDDINEMQTELDDIKEQANNTDELANDDIIEEEISIKSKPEPQREKASKIAIKNQARPKKINPEIADALVEDDEENADYSNKMYLLEKVKLEIEKEKLALERYRIKNEAKLKRQIERDRRREIMRMRKEKDGFAVNDGINHKQDENDENNFADAIGGVIKEINKEKPEVKDLITSTGIVTTPKSDLDSKKKKKHKRGTLVVKRSGSRYGE